MSFFLNVVPVREAIACLGTIAQSLPHEEVPLSLAFGRVLSEDILSDIDIPGFDRSVMDGYALISGDTAGATEAVPAMLRYKGRILMGGTGIISVAHGECAYIPTGGALPHGADAVVMVENSEIAGDIVLITKSAAPLDHVVMRGEDFSKGEIVIRKGRSLNAQDLGVLASVGRTSVPVHRVPRIGIISTGNELVPVGTVPRDGEVRDANSYLCAGFVLSSSCTPVLYGIVRDEKTSLSAMLARAADECDAVLLSGGSSKDDRDLSASVIGEAGEVHIHGVAIAPGKPTIIGTSHGKPVIGLPGHPASAYIVLMVIVRHLFSRLSGCTVPPLSRTLGVLTENIPSDRGREDYVRVTVRGEEVTPVFGKSGLLNTLVQSDGVICIQAGKEGLEKGEKVEVILW